MNSIWASENIFQLFKAIKYVIKFKQSLQSYKYLNYK